MKPAPGGTARQSLRLSWQQLLIRWWRCVSAQRTRSSRMHRQGAPSAIQVPLLHSV